MKKMNNGQTPRETIRQTILSMEKPFSLMELFSTLEDQGIENRQLIMDIVEELCESGVILYSEVIDDRVAHWVYQVVRSMSSV